MKQGNPRSKKALSAVLAASCDNIKKVLILGCVSAGVSLASLNVGAAPEPGKAEQPAPSATQSGTAPSKSGQGSPSQQGQWTSGVQAYQQVCAYCHDGGLVGPELRGRGLPPELFIAMARNGLRAMPAFQATFIDDKTLREVGEYLSKSTLDSESARQATPGSSSAATSGTAGAGATQSGPGSTANTATVK